MIAAVGPVSWDVVDGAPRRPGGTAFYSARALAHLGVSARIGASCAASDRPELDAQLARFGLPVRWFDSDETAAYRIRYASGGRRTMEQLAVATPWAPESAVAAAGDAEWAHVGALVRTDFPPETVAALASERKLLLDGQGLTRSPRLGALHRDGAFPFNVFRSVDILKLDDEEAEIVAPGAAPDELLALGAPEVLVTFGERGALVVTRAGLVRVPAADVGHVADPTGAGDMFSAAYLASRAAGAEPLEALHAATDTTAVLLSS